MERKVTIETCFNCINMRFDPCKQIRLYCTVGNDMGTCMPDHLSFMTLVNCLCTDSTHLYAKFATSIMTGK